MRVQSNCEIAYKNKLKINIHEAILVLANLFFHILVHV